MTKRSVLFGMLFTTVLLAQGGPFPLETVTVEGSSVGQRTVMSLADLRVGTPIDKAGMEKACERLEATGLFQSINYRYAPGPKNGVALTLALTDQPVLKEAHIDVPGVDESETWAWLKGQFPRFDRRVPDAGAAQEYLAKSIAGHLAEPLRGQSVVARLEQDLATKKMVISFQPETLPKVSKLTFTGEHAMGIDVLTGKLPKDAQDQGYTDRRFRQMVELNLRPAYEERGMYRVKFPSIASQTASDGSVAVNVAIEEGPVYKLGNVALKGDAPSTEKMQKAVHFPVDEIANWSEIQKDIDASNKILKREGYFASQATSTRMFDDEQHLLRLDLQYVKGPLFHMGAVRFEGFDPKPEAQAREMWELKAGDPFDYEYPRDFLSALAKKGQIKQFKSCGSKMQPGTGEHVMDLTIACK